MLRVTTSYLNPKPTHEKPSSLNPLASLLNFHAPKSPEDLKPATKRAEIRKATDSVDKISRPIVSPSRDILNLRRIFKIEDSSDMKNHGSNSPFKRNNLVSSVSAIFKPIDNRIESPSPELEQVHSYNRSKNFKTAEANELKTMNQVVEQFKKVSRDKATEQLNSNLNQGLAIETHRKKSAISNHLRTNRDFRKKDPPLNDIIHKKLGLDPATKERQGSHFASNLDREFSNVLGFRKVSSHGPSTKEDPNLLFKYENILPPYLTSLNKSEEQKKVPLTKKLSNLLIQGRGGSMGLKSVELDNLQAKGINQYEEKQGFYRLDLDIPSFELHDGGLHENKDHPTRHSLSLPEIPLKDEKTSAKQVQTPMSCSSLEELIPLKNFLSHSSPRHSNDNKKENEQASKTLSDNDKSDLKLILGRVMQTLNNDRLQMAAIAQENQRLNEEIQALKAKLSEFEAKKS